MPRESAAAGNAELLLAARLRRALNAGAFQEAEKTELEQLRKEFDVRGKSEIERLRQDDIDAVKTQCDTCWDPIDIENVRFFVCEEQGCRAALCCESCVRHHLDRHEDAGQDFCARDDPSPCSEESAPPSVVVTQEGPYPFSGLF